MNHTHIILHHNDYILSVVTIQPNHIETIELVKTIISESFIYPLLSIKGFPDQETLTTKKCNGESFLVSFAHYDAVIDITPTFIDKPNYERQ